MTRHEDWARAEEVFAQAERDGELKVGVLLQALSRLGPIRVVGTPPEPGGRWVYGIEGVSRRPGRPALKLRPQTVGATTARQQASQARADQARALHAQGLTHEEIAAELGLNTRTVGRYISPAGRRR